MRGRSRSATIDHLLSEVAQAADDVVVIAGGVLRASGTSESVLGGTDGPVTRVRAAEAARLAEQLRERGMFVAQDGAAAAAPRFASHDGDGDGPSALLVRGTSPDAVGAVAAEHGIALSELVAVSRSLDDAFLELTAEAA